MKKYCLKMIGTEPNVRVVKFLFPEGTYKRVDTSRTVTFTGERVNAQWRMDTEGVGIGLFSIISRVKKELKDNEQKIKWPTPQEYRVPYCAVQEWAGQSRLYELDLSAAYVRAAAGIGAISDLLALRLLQISKRSRLIALGATATRRTVTHYLNGVRGESEQKQDKLGRRFFEALSVKVAATMNALREAAGDSFAYYWADAIFVRTGEGALYVMERAKSLGVVIKDPEKFTGTIRGPLVHVSDGRTFPAKTLTQNPFTKGAEKPCVTQRIIKGKRIILASDEEMRILWDLARNKKALTSEQGLKLYNALPEIRKYNEGREGKDFRND